MIRQPARIGFELSQQSLWFYLGSIDNPHLGERWSEVLRVKPNEHFTLPLQTGSDGIHLARLSYLAYAGAQPTVHEIRGESHSSPRKMLEASFSDEGVAVMVHTYSFAEDGDDAVLILCATDARIARAHAYWRNRQPPSSNRSNRRRRRPCPAAG